MSITFFIVVNCIMLNLVFGIIIDTLEELREQSEKYGKKIYFFFFKFFLSKIGGECYDNI